MPEIEKQRILIVDDATENIDIITNVLTEYKKSVATNGEKALQIAFSDNPPDLILLDIVMPGIDGYEVCRRLKADERTKNIPVIFLTGETGSESVVKGFELGAVDYVTKPFNISELTARVNTQMFLKSSQDKIVRYTKDIEKKNKQITDSINYASNIQNAVLPSESDLSKLLGDFFVLFRPKDIVSGDFYWISSIDGKTILATADCIGHGVPGAFMSMLGIALLNEIVSKKSITKSGDILQHLRKEVISSLQQKGESGEQKDGMDISLCTIDFENRKLQYSGANASLYLIRKSDKPEVGLLRGELSDVGLLYEIKGEHMPVGISHKMGDFSTHEVDIYEGDTFYFFSDGYPDQFDNEDRKKFGYKQLRELLLNVNSKSMQQQKSIFEKSLNDWMGKNDQIDDILLIGFRIN